MRPAACLGPRRGRRNNAGGTISNACPELDAWSRAAEPAGPPGGVEVWRVWVEEGSVPPTAEGSFVIQPGRLLSGQKHIHIWKHTHPLCAYIYFFFVCSGDRSSFLLDTHARGQYQYAHVVFNLRRVQEKLAILSSGWGSHHFGSMNTFRSESPSTAMICKPPNSTHCENNS